MTQATRPKNQGQSLSLLGNQAGAVIVEQLIVFMPVFFFILATMQTVEVCSGMVLLRHAAFCAARAAIVVLPDDRRRYGDEPVYDGRRLDKDSPRFAAVKKAAKMILQTDRHFDVAHLELKLSVNPSSHELSAQLAAPYRCYARFVNAACAGRDAITLKAEGLNAYQGARYDY